jgi:colanic acid biosynthesis glycosyl transferase WcaI
MTETPLDILVIGHNYAPEPVGIAVYTSGMAEMLAADGHEVRVICGTPCYPHWSVLPGYSHYKVTHRCEGGVAVTRLPHFVPSVPRGWRRILHHLSFALLATWAMLRACWRRRPDVIVAIAPSILSTAVARLVATCVRRPLWIHVQDLELEVALATGQLPGGRRTAALLGAVERWALSGDRVSSISPAMRERLAAKLGRGAAVFEFRNWADPAVVHRAEAESPYRREWRIGRPHVVLYSGNIAAKQGVELVVEAARLLGWRTDIQFVICGNGANRAALEGAARGSGVMIHDLQPTELLGDLLALASVHVLPQIAGAADLVLPSKLPNMLASGRPVIATAGEGTGIAGELGGAGLLTPPHDARALADAIASLIDDPTRRAAMGAAGRRLAAARWNKREILEQFGRELRTLVVEAGYNRPVGGVIRPRFAQHQPAGRIEPVQQHP